MPQMKGELVTPEEVNGDEHDLDLPSIDYDLFKGYGNGSPFSTADMIRCAAYSCIYPSSYKVSKLTGVPDRTIRAWRQNAPWWPELIRQIKKHKNEELDAELTNIIMSAAEGLQDRLENGDTVLDKHGEERKIPLKAMDIAKVLGIGYDKRALLRGDPTSRTEKIGSQEMLKQLKNTFEAMAKGNKDPQVIDDAQYEEIPKGKEIN